MTDDEVTWHEDGDVVSVWVGRFQQQENLDRYLEERYRGEPAEDGTAVSEFAEDIGLRHYEPEYLEVTHRPGLSRQPLEIVRELSYAGSFGEAMLRDLDRGTGSDFDTVILLYQYDHLRYPQAQKKAARVRFVGSYVYDRFFD